MDTLRFILLVLGLLLVAGIITIDRAQKRKERRRKLLDDLATLEGTGRRDEDGALLDGEWHVGPARVVTPDDERAVESLSGLSTRDDDEVNDSEPAAQTASDIRGNLPVETRSATQPPAEELPRSQPAAEVEEAEQLVILTLLAETDKPYRGRAIRQAAETSGLRFGEHGLFHFYHDEQPVFSLANILEPGRFEPEAINSLKTPGLVLFMPLPGPDNALQAVDDMLRVASELIAELGGVLADQARQPLNEEGLQALRAQARPLDS